MENVTDRTHDPFGLSPPCEEGCDGGTGAVFGYGDANADFHLVGDHPGVHGGEGSGIPFTGPRVADLRAVLEAVGLVRTGPDGPFEPVGLFCSYLHMCCSDGPPTEADYRRLEPFFDAELRAIAAHVLLPVGDRALKRVLEQYTARTVPADAADLHATELRGRGFLVVPVRDPTDWTGEDRHRLESTLTDLLASDYRQTADLGRFLAEDATYLVR